MIIKEVLFSAGKTGFFFDDQRVIKQAPPHDGFTYLGKSVTPGFRSIRQAGESISIILVLEDGRCAVGDAAAVQYSGAGGRDPLFLAQTYIPFLEKNVRPLIVGRPLTSFRQLAGEFDAMKIEGRSLHTAIRYGLGQAFLDACALSQNRLMAETAADEYSLPLTLEPIPIFGQSGDDRYNAADKMILKEVDVLPHGLINNIDEKLGYRGEKLREYVSWLSQRIVKLRGNVDYRPALHIDVYGTIGTIFDNNPDLIADYLISLEGEAGEFPLYIEGPVDMEEKVLQIETLRKIKEKLEQKGGKVKIVADEWCNTYQDIVDFTDAKCCHMVQIKTPDLGSVHNIIESVLYCRSHGMESYQGGTCNETDVSARCCVHVALACRPERILAKPGMGFDEGFAIVHNEMKRALAVMRNRKK